MLMQHAAYVLENMQKNVYYILNWLCLTDFLNFFNMYFMLLTIDYYNATLPSSPSLTPSFKKIKPEQLMFLF